LYGVSLVRRFDLIVVSSNRPEAGLRVGVGPHARVAGVGPRDQQKMLTQSVELPHSANPVAVT